MTGTTHAVPARVIALEAHVASWASLGPGCVVHPFALVGRMPSAHRSLARHPDAERRLDVGAGTEIGPHAIIFAGVTIGRDCLIGDAASIRENARLGDRCIIGRGVTINYEAEIGDEVRIQDGTHITGGCKIGRGTFVGVNVTTSNDRRREIVDYVWAGAEPPVIGERCLIGSGACIIPGVRIGDGAVVGAGALVTRDVPPGGRALGTPAKRMTAAGILMAHGDRVDWPEIEAQRRAHLDAIRAAQAHNEALADAAFAAQAKL